MQAEDLQDRWIPERRLDGVIELGQHFMEGVVENLYGKGPFNEEEFDRCMEELLHLFEMKMPRNRLMMKPDYMSRRRD